METSGHRHATNLSISTFKIKWCVLSATTVLFQLMNDSKCFPAYNESMNYLVHQVSKKKVQKVTERVLIWWLASNRNTTKLDLALFPFAVIIIIKSFSSLAKTYII